MGGNPEVFFQINDRNAIRWEAHKCMQSGNLADPARSGSTAPSTSSGLLRRFQRIPLLAPLADSAIHRKHVGVTHLLQVVGRQRGPEAAATIEHQRSCEIGIFSLDIALDDPLAEVDRSRQMILVVFVIFADINQNKLVALVQPSLDFVDVRLAHPLFGVFDNLEETRWMLLRHTINNIHLVSSRLSKTRWM